MRAYRLVEWEQPPELVDAPEPVAPPGGVVVRVAGCGLCHSDVTMMQMPGAFGDALGWRVPFTLGHETAGWVHSIGGEVGPVAGLTVGDPVAVMSPTVCGACAECRRGNDRGCLAGLVGRGYGRDGGLAELLAVERVADLVALGAMDPRLAGPLTDAGATSYHAVDRVMAVLQPEQAGRTPVAVVVGVGGLGAFCVQILAARTAAMVVAVEPDDTRRARATDLGASVTFPSVEEMVAALGDLTGGLGADAVLDVVGTDDTIAASLRSLRSDGAFVLVGAGGGTLKGGWFERIPRGATVCRIQGSGRGDVAGVVALAAEGRVAVDAEHFALADVADAYARLDAGTLTARAVVAP